MAPVFQEVAFDPHAERAFSAPVRFVEHGLPAGRGVTYSLTADLTAFYLCPQASSVPLEEQASAVAVFRADPTGTISGHLEAGPGPAVGVTCPDGSPPRLSSAHYTNVELDDLTFKVRGRVSGELDRTS